MAKFQARGAYKGGAYKKKCVARLLYFFGKSSIISLAFRKFKSFFKISYIRGPGRRTPGWPLKFPNHYYIPNVYNSVLVRMQNSVILVYYRCYMFLKDSSVYDGSLDLPQGWNDAFLGLKLVKKRGKQWVYLKNGR